MIEKKRVDIYSLYRKEKMIRLEDDSGNFTEVILVKLTQGQRAEILKSYMGYLEDKKLELQVREDKSHALALAIEQYAKSDLITGILSFEKSQRLEIVDLLPKFDTADIKEREAMIKEEIEKFTVTRTAQLDAMDINELRQIFIKFTIESQATLDSARILNYQSLMCMCLDSETREPIFKSIDDVDKIVDKSTLEKLLEEMTVFRAVDTQKQIRDIAANEPGFLAVGDSQKSSTDSPIITS